MTEIETTGKKLTAEEWAECRAMYELGIANTPELSEKFGVSKQAISKHFKDNNVIKGSKKKEHDEKIAVAASASAAAAAGAKINAFESTRKAKIEETKTESYAMARNIQIQIHKLVIECQRSGAAFGTIYGDLKALRLAAAGVSQTRQDRYAILNVDRDVDEASLPILPIEDLSAVEIVSFQSNPLGDGLDEPMPQIDESDEIVETS